MAFSPTGTGSDLQPERPCVAPVLDSVAPELGRNKSREPSWQPPLPAEGRKRGPPQGTRMGQEKEVKDLPRHTEKPFTQPPHQQPTGNITLFPEKIYIYIFSIFLEQRKNNNILQELRRKYPTIPYYIFWNLPTAHHPLPKVNVLIKATS